MYPYGSITEKYDLPGVLQARTGLYARGVELKEVTLGHELLHMDDVLEAYGRNYADAIINWGKEGKGYTDELFFPVTNMPHGEPIPPGISAYKSSSGKYYIGNPPEGFAQTSKGVLYSKKFVEIEFYAEAGVGDLIGWTKSGRPITSGDISDYWNLQQGREPISSVGSATIRKIKEGNLVDVYHYETSGISSDVIGGVQANEQSSGMILLIKKEKQMSNANIQGADLLSGQQQNLKTFGIESTSNTMKKKSLRFASQQIEYYAPLQLEQVATPIGQNLIGRKTKPITPLAGKPSNEYYESRQTGKTKTKTYEALNINQQVQLIGETQLGENEERFTGEIGRSGIRVEPNIREETKSGFIVSPREIENIGISEREATSTRQEQKTQQDYAQLYNTKTLTRSITTPSPVKPRVTIILPKKTRQEPQREKYYQPNKKQKELISRPTRRRSGQLLPPDLLSVTESQARYGKASMPKQTRELFEKSARHLFTRTPTRELIESNKGIDLFNNKNNKEIIGGKKKNVKYY
jgi:hypothetical protein